MRPGREPRTDPPEPQPGLAVFKFEFAGLSSSGIWAPINARLPIRNFCRPIIDRQSVGSMRTGRRAPTHLPPQGIPLGLALIRIHRPKFFPASAFADATACEDYQRRRRPPAWRCRRRTTCPAGSPCANTDRQGGRTDSSTPSSRSPDEKGNGSGPRTTTRHQRHRVRPPSARGNRSVRSSAA